MSQALQADDNIIVVWLFSPKLVTSLVYKPIDNTNDLVVDLLDLKSDNDGNNTIFIIPYAVCMSLT